MQHSSEFKSDGEGTLEAEANRTLVQERIDLNILEIVRVMNHKSCKTTMKFRMFPIDNKERIKELYDKIFKD